MLRNRKRIPNTKVDSLIGKQTELRGDIHFNGRLHVDGAIKGNVYALSDNAAVLTLTEQGSIEGEVNVPNVVLNGSVIGDVKASNHIELWSKARITGNVYYRLIEMAMGAEVNGSLIHTDEDLEPKLKLESGPLLGSTSAQDTEESAQADADKGDEKTG